LWGVASRPQGLVTAGGMRCRRPLPSQRMGCVPFDGTPFYIPWRRTGNRKDGETRRNGKFRAGPPLLKRGKALGWLWREFGGFQGPQRRPRFLGHLNNVSGKTGLGFGVQPSGTRFWIPDLDPDKGIPGSWGTHPCGVGPLKGGDPSNLGGKDLGGATFFGAKWA